MASGGILRDIAREAVASRWRACCGHAFTLRVQSRYVTRRRATIEELPSLPCASRTTSASFAEVSDSIYQVWRCRGRYEGAQAARRVRGKHSRAYRMSGEESPNEREMRGVGAHISPACRAPLCAFLLRCPRRVF